MARVQAKMYLMSMWICLVPAAACDAGSYLNVEDNTCELCPLGTYQPLRLQIFCQQCPANETTASRGARHISECQCK